MILCCSCKRVWPKGTVFCGSCGATLGTRLCPENHRNPVDSQCCATCGSKKLSKAVLSLNLRPISTLISVAIVVVAAPPVIFAIIGLAQKVWCGVVNAVLPWLVGLGMLSFILGGALGEKSRKVILEFWVLILKLLLYAPAFVFRILRKAVTKTKT